MNPYSAAASLAGTKDRSLEGLRGLACLGVLLSHFMFSFLPSTAQWLTKGGAGIPQFYDFESVLRLPVFLVFFNGSFPVSIFFAMSGYVLTKKYFDTNDPDLLRSGAAKRYPRLVIPALVSMIFAYALLKAGLMCTQLAPDIGSAGWPMDAYKSPVGVLEVMWEFLSLPFAGTAPLNAPLWTIMLELIGSFLMFATYALFGSRRPVAAAILFAVLSMLVFRASFVQVHLLTVFAGSLLHYIKREWLGIPALPVVMIVAGMIGGAYDFSPWFDWARIPMPTLPVPLPDLAGKEREVFNALGAFLLVGGVLGSNAIARGLSCRPFAYLGKISFSLYLLHWPIICSLSFGTMYLLKVRNGIDYLWAVGVTAIVTMAAVVAGAHLFEILVDRWAIRLAGIFSVYILGSHGPRLPRPQDSHVVAGQAAPAFET